MVPGVPLLTHTSVHPTALSPHPSVPPPRVVPTPGCPLALQSLYMSTPVPMSPPSTFPPTSCPYTSSISCPPHPWAHPCLPHPFNPPPLFWVSPCSPHSIMSPILTLLDLVGLLDQLLMLGLQVCHCDMGTEGTKLRSHRYSPLPQSRC